MTRVPKLQSSVLQAINEKQRGGITARLVKPGLSLAASMYSAPVRARNYLYDRGLLRVVKLPVPVISVGNITVGGAGKTPMVEWIAGFLRGKGVKSAILSRGYGALKKPSGNAGADGAGRVNDEFLMLSENLGTAEVAEPHTVVHLAGPDRARLGEEAIEEHDVKCIILDDGFQHRRLHRDLDVVLIDCLRPFGFCRVLPRGLLREPLSGLRRAHVFVLSRTDQCSAERTSEIRDALVGFNAKASVVESVHKPIGLVTLDALGSSAPYPAECIQSNGLGRLAGKNVFAFCGVGNPEAFRRTLIALDARIVSFRVFPDHYRYSDKDLVEIADAARQSGADMIVTTQKDTCRLRQQAGGETFNKHRFDAPLLTLKVKLEMTRDGEALTEAIEKCVMRET